MKLNEAEMRMAYQIESTDPNAVLNEIYMTWRLSRNQATAGYPRMINRRAIATVLSIRKKILKKYALDRGYANIQFYIDDWRLRDDV